MPLLLLLPLLTVAPPARAGDAEPSVEEVWRFTDGEHERVIDVSAMPPFVRRALVERLAAQGFTRLPAAAPDLPGRDLEADVRELIRHQGRFPARTEPLSVPRPALLARFLRALRARMAPQARLLGAPVRRREGGAWHVIAVAPGTVAAAVGLRPGDEVVTLDGGPTDARGLSRWATAPAEGGKLSLGIRRREGRILTTCRFAIEFTSELEIAPAGE